MEKKLSNADQTYLSPEQQKQIEAFKKQYAAASNLSDPDLRAAAQKEAHEGAEAVRAQAAYGGYSAGADGTGYTKNAAGQGGQTAQQVAARLGFSYDLAEAQNSRGFFDHVRILPRDAKEIL